MKPFLAALVIVIMLPLCATTQEHTKTGVVRHVSIIRLIASPEEYDGKSVNVVGFLKVEFEGNAIYLHREDYLKALTENAIQLDMPDPKVYLKYDRQYVLVEGTFVKCDDARFTCTFSGRIEKIRRLESWRFQRE